MFVSGGDMKFHWIVTGVLLVALPTQAKPKWLNKRKKEATVVKRSGPSLAKPNAGAANTGRGAGKGELGVGRAGSAIGDLAGRKTGVFSAAHNSDINHKFRRSDRRGNGSRVAKQQASSMLPAPKTLRERSATKKRVTNRRMPQLLKSDDTH